MVPHNRKSWLSIDWTQKWLTDSNTQTPLNQSPKTPISLFSLLRAAAFGGGIESHGHDLAEIRDQFFVGYFSRVAAIEDFEGSGKMGWGNGCQDGVNTRPLFLVIYATVIAGIVFSSLYVFSAVYSSSNSVSDSSSSWFSSPSSEFTSTSSVSLYFL